MVVILAIVGIDKKSALPAYKIETEEGKSISFHCKQKPCLQTDTIVKTFIV